MAHFAAHRPRVRASALSGICGIGRRYVGYRTELHCRSDKNSRGYVSIQARAAVPLCPACLREKRYFSSQPMPAGEKP